MKTVRFKEGVLLSGLQPEMLGAIDVCAEIFESNGLALTITSARGGNHSKYSHHYKGLAIDIRVWEITGRIEEFCETIRAGLGSAYQVINENTHIHIEYDPINAASAFET